MSAAWGETAHWWQTYLEQYPTGAGAAAARWWRARALEKLGDRQTAAALLRVLSDDLTPLEKTARLYLAQQLKTGQ